jgi:hypothetical protein
VELLVVFAPALLFATVAVAFSAVGAFGMQPEAGTRERRNRRAAVLAGVSAFIAVAWLFAASVWTIAVLFSGGPAD